MYHDNVARQLEQRDQKRAQCHGAQVKAEQPFDRASDWTRQICSIATEVPRGDGARNDHLLAIENELAHPEQRDNKVPPLADQTSSLVAVTCKIM